MTASKRAVAIQSFQEDPDIQVMLVSITCGGAGYKTNYFGPFQWQNC